MFELMEDYDCLPELQQKAINRFVKTYAAWHKSMNVDELQEAQDDILQAFDKVHGLWLQHAATCIDPMKAN